MNKNKMYVYLARRDKGGVKIIGGFDHSKKVYPTKLSEEDLFAMNMNQAAASEIVSESRKARMEYDLFVETAESFEKLRSSLASRGYSRIPHSHFPKSFNAGKINETPLVTKDSIMMRRGSSRR